MQFTYDYRGMGQWLVGPEAQRLVQSKTNDALMLFQAIVAKRSGDLARSARATTKLGGLKGQRWMGVLTVGNYQVPYAASHQFGYDDGDEKIVAGHHELEVVLANLGKIP